MPFDDFTFSPIALAAPAAPVLLPHVPSRLLRIGLADLAKVEAMPERYEIDMSWYHAPASNALCSVCTAGSIMAMTFGVNHKEYVSPARLGAHNHNALMFISHCTLWGWRGLNNQAALDLIGARDPNYWGAHTSYHDDPIAFRASINAIADAFAESGQ